jgi:hypothetical protein
VLVVLTLAAYLPLAHNDFIDYDDEPYITHNASILRGLTSQGFVWAWTNGEAPYWHPITWLSLQLDAQFFSTRTPDGETVLSPIAFHGENLFWHVAAALLLFGCWHRLSGARLCSFVIAALFALHPMHVESVAWAIERKDVLSTFFGVLTLWTYAVYAERPSLWRYLGVVAALLLSLLSKPMLMTLPLVLLLLDYWPLRRLQVGGSGVSLRRLVIEKVPLFILAFAVAAITLVRRLDHGAFVGLEFLPLSARLTNALAAYGWYVVGTFYPVDLAVLYPHPYQNWSVLSVLTGAATLLVTSAVCLWQARRRPWLAVGWFWFVGSLVPVIGLVQGGSQGWADRFSYWPHIGLFAAVVFGLREVALRLRLPTWLPISAATLALAVLAVLTWRQVQTWRDTRILWEHALAVTESNAPAHQHLATAYRRQGWLAEADFHLLSSYRIQASRVRRLTGLGARPVTTPVGGPDFEQGSRAAVPVAGVSVMP